jgi:hypothetical protein
MDIENPEEEIFVRKRSVRYRPSGLTQATDDMKISLPDNLAVIDDDSRIALPLPTPSFMLNSATVTPSSLIEEISSNPSKSIHSKEALERTKFDPSTYDFKYDREISSDIFYNKPSKSRVAMGSFPADPEGLYALCLEPVIQGKSVMLFCPSKARCEVCAGELANIIKNCPALNTIQRHQDTHFDDRSNSNRGSMKVKAASDRESIEGPNQSPGVAKHDVTVSRSTLLDELRLAPVRLCEVRHLMSVYVHSTVQYSTVLYCARTQT